MKELFSFLAAKTQSLVGQRFLHLENPGTTSFVGHERLAFLSEAFNSLGPDTDLGRFVADLDGLKLTDRVVCFEGAFSAAIRLDVSNPRELPRAVELAELAPDHLGGLGLGVGHALANLQVEADITPELADHFLGFMAMDAYGMHKGYFNWFDSIQNLKMPVNLPPNAMAAYDQGLGRALWFISAGEPKALQQIIDRFPLVRRSSMWRGIGLMTAFWGGLEEPELRQYLKISKQFRPCLQQGAAQGVSLRTDMGEVVAETEVAAKVICGATAEEIAAVAEASLIKCTNGPFDTRSYLEWQKSLTDFFIETGAK